MILKGGPRSPTLLDYLKTFALAAGFCASTFALAAIKKNFSLEFKARHARSLLFPEDTTSNRVLVNLDQELVFNSSFSAQVGGHAEYETVYAQNLDRFGENLAHEDSQQFWLRDTYLSYRTRVSEKMDASLRLGYQTVIWGEAFGFAYADVVNPKDFRELPFGDQQDRRISLPMANLQFLGETWSLQFLYLPAAQHHLLPLEGSYYSTFTPTTTRIKRQDMVFDRSDLGVRISKQLGTFDVSLFHLDAVDRFPVYSSRLGSNGILTLTPGFTPIKTAGMTTTADLNWILLRAEVVDHYERYFQTANMGSLKSSELIYVVGFDFPQWEWAQLGIQYSEFTIEKKANLAFRENKEQLASLRIARDFFKNVATELLLSAPLHEESFIGQLNVHVPTSRRSEWVVGVESISGKKDTFYGSQHEASRFFLELRSIIKE